MQLYRNILVTENNLKGKFGHVGYVGYDLPVSSHLNIKYIYKGRTRPTRPTRPIKEFLK